MSEIAYHYRVLSTGLLPFWLGALLGAAAVGLALWLLRRECARRRGKARSRWLFATRGVVVLGLAWLVVQPVLFIRRDETRPALLLVAVDGSRSMLRSDAYDQSTLLNLATAIGATNLGDRDDLADRLRKELLGWRPDLVRWQTQAARTHDELTQGIPPASAFAQLARAAGAELQSRVATLRRATEELAKLQVRLTRPVAGVTNAVAGLDAHWFAAPDDLAAVLVPLAEKWQGLSAGEMTEAQTLALLQAHGAALAGLEAAGRGLAALQGFGDAQLAKSQPAEQRAVLQQITGASRFELGVRTFAAITNNADLARRHTFRLLSGPTLEAGAAEDHTDLYELVKRSLAAAGSTSVAGLVLVSDGQQNLPDRPEILRELAGRKVPFVAAGVGVAAALPDAALEDFAMSTTLLAGQRTTVRADLKTAVPVDTELALTLTLNGEVLAEKRWKADGSSAQVALTFTVPAAVTAPLVLAVKTAQPDAAPNNDQAEIGVTVLAEPARILIVSPAPRWDMVYLIRALGQTPWRVDTLFWERTADDETGAPDQAAIAKQFSQLANYQLVILDGQPFPGWSAEDFNRVREYVVTNGGNVLVTASGAAAWYGEPLAPLLGSVPAGATTEVNGSLAPSLEAAHLPVVGLAADDAESQAIWQGLAAPQQVRPVLAQTVPLLLYRQQPCLSVGFYGRGKIYLVGVSDLFRAREWTGAPVVSRFLARLVDDALCPAFAAAGAKVAVYPPMPAAGATARVVLAQPPDLLAPAGKAGFATGAPVALTFQREATGRAAFSAPWRITQAGAGVVEVAGADKLAVRSLAALSLEDVSFNLDAERLQRMADDGEGTYVGLADVPRRLATVPAQKDVTTTMRVVRLWNPWFLLVLLAAALTVDWVLRRKQGLVL